MSYIFLNPEPLGEKFKTVACYVTGSLIFLEIQRGEEGMKPSWYHLELGSPAACTNILMEETKEMGKRDVKVSTRDCFLFYSWFSSKKAAGAAASIGVDFIGMLKINIKLFCKATLEGLTKDWLGGSYIVLRSKPMVPGERQILAIGYKCNYR